MARCPIVCVWPDGENFRVTVSEADAIVADNLGEWDGRKTVRMDHHDRTGGRLSLILGARLAESSRRNESWARVAVSEVLGR